VNELDAIKHQLKHEISRRQEAEHALEREHDLARALEKAAVSLTSTLDPDQVLDRILEQVDRVVPNDAANIMLVEGTQKVRVVRWRGYDRLGSEIYVSSTILNLAEVRNLRQMYETGEPVIITDTKSYNGWVSTPEQTWINSYAGVPIQIRDKIIGFLNVDSHSPGFFTEGHVEALRAFASYAAAAIENARLYKAEQERRRISETFLHASAAFISTLELGEVLDLILSQLRLIIPYDSASVQRLKESPSSSPENCYLEIVACQGFPRSNEVVGRTFPLDPTFPNHKVITKQKSMALKDVIIDYPHFHDGYELPESGPIRSWLGVPLMVKDKIIGMLSIDRADRHPYTGTESQLAMVFANQAAIAMENTRLYNETHQLAAFNQSIIQSMSEGIATEDAEGYYTFVNPAGAEMLGYSPEDLLGSHWTAVVSPDQHAIVEAANERRKSGQSDRYELEFIHSNGRRVSSLVSGSPRFDPDGNFSGTMAVFTNITERKRAEIALKESELRFRSVYDTAPLAFVLWDRGCLVTDWNQHAEKLFGWSKEEVLGRNFFDFLIPEPERPQIETIVSSLLRGELPSHNVNKNLTKDGEIIICEWNNSIRYDTDGQIAGVMSLALDITKRKRTEHALLESEARNRAILNALPDMIFVQSRDGTYLDYHVADTDMLYAPPEQFIGKKMQEFLPEEFASIFLVLIEKAISTSKTQVYEYQLPIADSLRVFEARVVPHGEDKVLSVIREITERKRAEEQRDELQEQLLQSQKMQAVGVLAGGVAHDFNNILTTIVGNAQLALTTLRKDDPLAGDLQEIKRAADKGAGLTRQLLIFSRKETLRAEVLSLNDIVENLEKMLRRLIGEDMKLQLNLSTNLTPVKADPGQIEQVIMNLVVNAREAMPQGGTIVIETANTALDKKYAETHAEVKPGRYAMLKVTDFGCGMDKKTQSHMFEPFFTTKERGKGTGLGLSTVYGIIKQSGGDIQVLSSPGKGTTIKILLPQTKAPAETVQERSDSKAKIRSRHILVVEDEESVRNLMRKLLIALGHNASVAANGLEALKMIEEYKLIPELVITDMVMPGMSGSELGQRLKETYPNLKVLYMSGYTDGGIVPHGAVDLDMPFIKKPFNINDLAAKLQEIFPHN